MPQDTWEAHYFSSLTAPLPPFFFFLFYSYHAPQVAQTWCKN